MLILSNKVGDTNRNRKDLLQSEDIKIKDLQLYNSELGYKILIG